MYECIDTDCYSSLVMEFKAQNSYFLLVYASYDLIQIYMTIVTL